MLKKTLSLTLATALILALAPVLIGLGITMLTYSPAEAATSCNIDVTAQGSEIDISCNVTLWDIGIWEGSDSPVETGLTWGEITNNGSEAVDLTVYGNDMDDGVVVVTWVCGSAAGAAQFEINLGLEGGSYNQDVKKEGDTPYTTWKSGLASLGTQAFGFQFNGPTTGVGNEAMTMTNGSDGMAGLVITASL